MQKNTDITQIEILKNLIKLDEPYEKNDKYKYNNGNIAKTIRYIKRDIKNSLKIIKFFKEKSDRFEKNLPYYHSAGSEKKYIIKLNQSEEYKTKLNKILQQKKELEDLLNKFTTLLEDTIIQLIYLELENSKDLETLIENLKQNYISKETFNYIKKKEKNSTSKIDILPELLNSRIQNQFKILKLYHLKNKEMNIIENKEINPAINEYKKNFYINETLNLPKNMNKKQINLFINNVKNLIINLTYLNILKN